MRTSVIVLLFAILVVGARSGARADDPGDARDIVAKAIRAVGGEEQLARYKARTWKEKATYHGTDGDEQYEASYTALWPDKLKVEIGDFTLVVNGDKGWVKIKGDTREMTRAELEEHREGTYSIWIMSLVPLGNKELHLSTLGERKVIDRPADGVKVSRKGHFDVSMFFDKETSLLAMSETRFKEARSGKEVQQETIFSGYKEESGIKSPTHVSIKRDGKQVVEATIELKHLERLGEGAFAKP
jgi:hypothetical protein